MSTQLNGSLVAVVSIALHRCEYAKLAYRWPAAIGGHNCLSRLFDVHARLSNDLILSLIVWQQNTHSYTGQ